MTNQQGVARRRRCGVRGQRRPDPARAPTPVASRVPAPDAPEPRRDQTWKDHARPTHCTAVSSAAAVATPCSPTRTWIDSDQLIATSAHSEQASTPRTAPASTPASHSGDSANHPATRPPRARRPAGGPLSRGLAVVMKRTLVRPPGYDSRRHVAGPARGDLWVSRCPRVETLPWCSRGYTELTACGSPLGMKSRVGLFGSSP